MRKKVLFPFPLGSHWGHTLGVSGGVHPCLAMSYYMSEMSRFLRAVMSISVGPRRPVSSDFFWLRTRRLGVRIPRGAPIFQ